MIVKICKKIAPKRPYGNAGLKVKYNSYKNNPLSVWSEAVGSDESSSVEV